MAISIILAKVILLNIGFLKKLIIVCDSYSATFYSSPGLCNGLSIFSLANVRGDNVLFGSHSNHLVKEVE